MLFHGVARVVLFAIALGIVIGGEIRAQCAPSTPDFYKTADKKMRKNHARSLFEACPVAENLGARTILREYGAIFVAGSGAVVPSRCVFENEDEVAEFQKLLRTSTKSVGGIRITLQEPAMKALDAAIEEAAGKGLSITPRGGSRAAARSFAATKSLWDSRFLPGLAHWRGRGKITAAEAEEARNAPIPEQVSMVLKWEQEGIFFAKDFSKSILFSVAAPGASQHISLLALDVSQFGDRRVREILASHGWFQTVRSDLPHFTFLGVREVELPRLGLVRVQIAGHDYWVPDIPDSDR